MESDKRVFNYEDYLNQYYKSPQGHSEENMDNTQQQWTCQAFDIIPESQSCLEIGCGPVLCYAACASRKCKNIFLSEYNTECFRHISSYLKRQGNEKDQFWSPRFSVISKIEGIQLSKIENRLRSSVSACFKCDLTEQDIINVQYLKRVDVIISSLCIQAVAKDLNEYSTMIKKVKNHLKKNGYLYFFGVLEETFYMVKDQKLPCLSLTEDQIKTALVSNNFEVLKFNSMRPQNPPTQTSDFKGVFSVLAKSID